MNLSAMTPMERMFRFFCGRRGAAMARALITVWTLVAVPLGGAIWWASKQAVDEFRSLKESIHKLELYVAADLVRGDTRDRALAAALAGVIENKAEMAQRLLVIDRTVAEHDRRLIRLEVRGERANP